MLKSHQLGWKQSKITFEEFEMSNLLPIADFDSIVGFGQVAVCCSFTNILILPTGGIEFSVVEPAFMRLGKAAQKRLIAALSGHPGLEFFLPGLTWEKRSSAWQLKTQGGELSDTLMYGSPMKITRK